MLKLRAGGPDHHFQEFSGCRKKKVKMPTWKGWTILLVHYLRQGEASKKASHGITVSAHQHFLPAKHLVLNSWCSDWLSKASGALILKQVWLLSKFCLQPQALESVPVFGAAFLILCSSDTCVWSPLPRLDFRQTRATTKERRIQQPLWVT